jgi:hypothetical protein
MCGELKYFVERSIIMTMDQFVDIPVIRIISAVDYSVPPSRTYSAASRSSKRHGSIRIWREAAFHE